jgi:hypothetical protein
LHENVKAHFPVGRQSLTHPPPHQRASTQQMSPAPHAAALEHAPRGGVMLVGSHTPVRGLQNGTAPVHGLPRRQSGRHMPAQVSGGWQHACPSGQVIAPQARFGSAVAALAPASPAASAPARPESPAPPPSAPAPPPPASPAGGHARRVWSGGRQKPVAQT